jgi:hypothetical protein
MKIVRPIFFNKIFCSIIFYLLLMVISICGCKKQFDINQSPNALTAAPINTVLTNVTVNVGFIGGSDLHRFTSLWVQQFGGQNGAFSPTVQFENYNVVATDFINLWQAFYSTTLEDVEYIINNSAESPHYNGIAKIIKAWCFQHMVDVWGDIPFSEALQLTAIKYPKLDSGQNIYSQLISLLDDGIAKLSDPAEGLIPMGNNETIYGGVRVKWIKMANTLKMRIYLHYSEIDEAKVKAGIDGIVSAGVPVIDANADNFQMVFVDAPNAQNPLHQYEIRQANQFFPNNVLVTMMNTKADPRRPFYFTAFPYNSTPANYKGVKPNDPQGYNFSRMNTYLRGAIKNTPVSLDGSLTATAVNYTGAAPIKMLTAAEYYFIRAEAALRFGAIGNAQTLYQSGIRASMELAGVNAVAIDAYISANSLPTGTMLEQLKKLIEEKYVALYGVALEPYNDWRRTGYPLITPVISGTLTAIPTIFYYPQSEVNANPNCVQKKSLSEKVFWDK